MKMPEAVGDNWPRRIFARVLRGARGKRVLFAWELGGGLGHVGRLSVVASALRGALPDFVPTFALRERLSAVGIRTAFPSAKVYAAPVFRREPSERVTKFQASSYSDMLSLCGYADVDTLAAMLEAWRGLYDEVQPDLIVCDHSPTAVLAAGGRIPVVHIGTGFAVPPGRSYLASDSPAAREAVEREKPVLAIIQEACRRLALPAPAQIYDLLNWAENIPCCLPELDPYRRVRGSEARGPFEPLPSPQTAAENDRIFGYLTADDVRLPEILRSLADTGVSGRIFIREGSGPYEQFVAGSGIELVDQPQPLATMLKESAGILHHGGLSTTQVALAIGRPQFLLPRHGEQRLTANAIERLGCGINLRRHSNPAKVLSEQLSREAYTRACRAMAQRLFERPLCSREEVLNACLNKLGCRRWLGC